MASWIGSSVGSSSCATSMTSSAVPIWPISGHASCGSPSGCCSRRRTAVSRVCGCRSRVGGTGPAPRGALVLDGGGGGQAGGGGRPQTEGGLDAVDGAFEGRRPAEDPPWVYWLDRDEIDVMTGRCYTELRRPAEAVPLLS